MLSPLRFHEHVPRDLLKNVRFRKKIILRCQEDNSFRNRIKDICARDILFWINTFVWQVEFLQEDEGTIGPFITWPCQERALLKRRDEAWPGDEEEDAQDAGLIECMEKGETALMEKSRDMGASWLCILILDWRFLFHKWMKFLCISRSDDAVDNPGDHDSLFWKFDFVHKRLPVWMLPEGGIRRRKGYFGNEANNNSITGQASTGLAGVGGRATCMFIDEFALIRQDGEVRGFTANTARCRIFNSTHRGLDTEMFKMSRETQIVKIMLHWTMHPRKVQGLYRSGHVPEILDKQYVFPPDYDFVRSGEPLGGPFPGIRSVWYDAKCKDIGSDAKVAMDLDINPERTVSQFFSPMLIDELIRHHACEPVWEGEIEYDRLTGESAKLVRSAGGRLKLWVRPGASGLLPRGRFGAGADIAMGTGASNSCLSIGNADTGNKEAEYRNPAMSPDEFSVFCFALLGLFRDSANDPPLLAWEHKGPGALFTKKIKELGYRRFYYRRNELDVTGMSKDATEPGWNPSPANKLLLLNEYQEALRKRTFLNRSQSALEDTLVWKYNKNGYPVYGKTDSDDPSGARDNHGDPTIADALCNKMMQQLGVSEQKKIEEAVPFGSMKWRHKMFHEGKRRESWVS